MNENSFTNINENEWNVEGMDNSNIYACPNCKKNIEKIEIEECPFCHYNFVEGMVINTETGEEVSYNSVRTTYEKIKKSELVQSIKEDLKNSKSIELVKSYFSNFSSNRKKKKEEKKKKKAEIEALEEQIRQLKKK